MRCVVGLLQVLHQRDERALVRGQRGRRMRRQRIQHLALGVDQPRKTRVVELHPLGRVVRAVVLPGGEPQQHQAHVMLARLAQQRVEEREIELAFDGLDLLPGDGHADGVGLQLLHRRPDLWQHGRPGAGVVHLRAEHEERRAVDHERGATVARHDLRYGLRRLRRCARRTARPIPARPATFASFVSRPCALVASILP